jgi:hypothetical protein
MRHAFREGTMKRFGWISSFIEPFRLKPDPDLIMCAQESMWPKKKDLTRLLWLFLAIAILGCVFHFLSDSRSEAILYVNEWLWLCFIVALVYAGLFLVELVIGSISWLWHWLTQRRIR